MLLGEGGRENRGVRICAGGVSSSPEKIRSARKKFEIKTREGSREKRKEKQKERVLFVGGEKTVSANLSLTRRNRTSRREEVTEKKKACRKSYERRTTGQSRRAYSQEGKKNRHFWDAGGTR